MHSVLPLKLSAQLVEKWLAAMGIAGRNLPVSDPQLSWQLEFDQPQGKMMVVGPKERPRCIVVMANVAISPEHHAAFNDLDQDERLAFVKELSTTLSREFVEFAFVGSTTLSECPTGFQVTSTRYDDGLTLDSFSRTVSSVYKAELSGIACVQVHLTPKGGGAGSFDFKRMGRAIQ